MIGVATKRYNIENNRSFIRMIFTITKLAWVCGEIIGPVTNGLLAHAIGFNLSISAVAFGFFGFAAIYCLGTINNDELDVETSDSREYLLSSFNY